MPWRGAARLDRPPPVQATIGKPPSQRRRRVERLDTEVEIERVDEIDHELKSVGGVCNRHPEVVGYRHRQMRYGGVTTMSSQPEMAIEVPRVARRGAARLFAPGPLARRLARLRRFPLDRDLSDGADPAASPQLAARAAWLGRRRTRAEIASGLERLAQADLLPAGRWRSLPSQVAVRENADALLELAALLRSDRRLYVRGIARLDLLLIDGAGPAFTDRRGEALARELELARAALAG